MSGLQKRVSGTSYCSFVCLSFFSIFFKFNENTFMIVLRKKI